MVTTKGQQARQRILEAAAELFYRKGYHSVGINEVLAAADAPKGSFYHYFQGKEEVAREAIIHFGQRLLQRVSNLMLGPNRNSGADAVRNFVQATTEEVRRGGTVASCPLGSLGMQLSTVPDLAGLADDYLAQLLSLLRQFFETRQARGELAPDSQPDRLAKEFLYLYEGSLVIATIRGSTNAFTVAMESFIETHFRGA